MSIGRTIATGSDLHGQRLERLTHDHKIQRSALLHPFETMPSLLIGPFLVQPVKTIAVLTIGRCDRCDAIGSSLRSGREVHGNERPSFLPFQGLLCVCLGETSNHGKARTRV